MICSTLRQGDLSRLIRVHSTLWENVIRSVWEKVPWLSCLSNLIPRTRAGDTDLAPGPEQQWARFDMYAKYIRELKVEFQWAELDTYTALLNAWLQRQQYSDCPNSFAPHVQHLTVVLPAVNHAMESVDAWAPLLSDALVSFNLTISIATSGVGSNVYAMVTPCLEALRNHASRLQTLTLQVSEMFGLPESCAQTLVKTVRALDRLTSLGLDFSPGIRTRVVREILAAGQFTRLYVGSIDEGYGEETSTWDVPGGLVSLGLVGDHDEMRGLVEAIGPSSLKRLTFKQSETSRGMPQEPSVEAASRMLERFPNLVQLELDLTLGGFDELLLSRDQLRNLTHLTLGPEACFSISLSEQVLSSLAALLPKIEELRIIQEGPDFTIDIDEPASCILLPALECFATSCPRLRKLSLAVSIRHASQKVLAKLQPHPALRDFDMLQSTIPPAAEPDNVAGTIAKLFPKLASFAYIGDDDANSDDSVTDTL
ncbi:hypothetical protein FRB90_010634, partial [Tulasnella sp. 427]